jgi:hypothetical protein
MGSLYNKSEIVVIYLVSWLKYVDYKDWIEELFEHIMIAFKILYQFYCSNMNIPIDPHLRG